MAELVHSGPGRGRCGGAGGSPTQRADRRSPLPPEPATRSGQIALWRTRGSRGAGVGVLLRVFSSRFTGAESEPRADSRWLPGPSPLGSCLRDSRTQCQRPGSLRKGASEGFVNGATARKLRLADAKGLVSRVRRKAIYGRVAGFPSVYAQPLPLGTRSNSVFLPSCRICCVKRKKEV